MAAAPATCAVLVSIGVRRRARATPGGGSAAELRRRARVRRHVQAGQPRAGIALDLKNEAAASCSTGCCSADIFVDVRIQALARLELGYEELHERYPS